MTPADSNDIHHGDVFEIAFSFKDKPEKPPKNRPVIVLEFIDDQVLVLKSTSLEKDYLHLIHIIDWSRPRYNGWPRLEKYKGKISHFYLERMDLVPRHKFAANAFLAQLEDLDYDKIWNYEPLINKLNELFPPEDDETPS